MWRCVVLVPLLASACLAQAEKDPPKTAEEWFQAVEARYRDAKTVYVKAETRDPGAKAPERTGTWFGGKAGYRIEALGEDGKVFLTTVSNGTTCQRLDAQGKPEALGWASDSEAWGRHHFVRRGTGWNHLETGDKEIPMKDLKLDAEEQVEGKRRVVLEWTVMWAAYRVTPIPQKVWIDPETLAIVRREWTVREGTVKEIYSDTKFDAEPPANAFQLKQGK